MEPLAFLGGTFDPVHYGHLRCAEEVRQKLYLDRLYLLPARNPPHRAAPGRSVDQRLKLLKLALSEFPNLGIDCHEIKRSGPSYMVDTLQQLRVEFPRRPLWLLLGQDAANQLHGWDRWQQLFALTNLVVLSRPGIKAQYRSDVAAEIEHRIEHDPSVLSRFVAGRVLPMKVRAHDISATSIKVAIRRGQIPTGMMPVAEMDYISQHGLYVPRKCRR